MAENKEDIAYLSDLEEKVDKVAGATPGNIVVFGNDGSLQNSSAKPSDFCTQEDIESAVDAAADNIKAAVQGEYAVQAFNSAPWSTSKAYAVGDTCMYDGVGYKCKTAHTSGSSFDASKWDVVLTADGKLALETFAQGSRYVTYDNTFTNHAQISETYYPIPSRGSLKQVVSAAFLGYATNSRVTVSVYACDSTPSGSTALPADAELIATSTGGVVILQNEWGVFSFPSNSIPASATGLIFVFSGTVNVSLGTQQSGFLTYNGSWRSNWALSAKYVFKADSFATTEDLAKKADKKELAPDFNPAAHYTVGQTVIKDGVFKECIEEGTGEAARFRITTVEAMVAPLRAGAVDPDDKADSDAIDEPYAANKAYSVGDTCMYEGMWYKCKTAIALPGEPWTAGHWEAITVKQAATTRVQSDWTETDTDSPAYIQHKPNIPESAIIDDTLTHQGQAADAKAVGDRLAEKDKRYERKTISATLSDSVFTLSPFNKAVNYAALTVSEDRSVSLAFPPVATGEDTVPRDFYLVTNITSTANVMINVPLSITLKDAWDVDVELVAQAGRWNTFRFFEISSNVFLVTGANDPARKAVKEIERALDDILDDGGGASYRPGLYAEDSETGLFHKIVAVTDAETGIVSVGIEQEGVQR